MCDDNGDTPSSELTGSIILDNPQVYDLVITRLSDRVAEGIREKNAHFRNWLIGILTIVVIILTTGGAFTLKYFVDEAVDPAVAKAVDPAVAKAADAILFSTEVSELNFRVLNLDISDSFTSEEAESVIWTIQSLVSKGDDQRLGKLVYAVDTAVKNFAAVDRLDLVMRLEGVAPSLFLNSATVIQTMFHANGLALFSDAGAPNSWTDTTGSRSETYKNYRTYADRAELAGYPELYLLYEILLAYIERRPTEVINNLIEDVDSLNEEDAEHFIQVMKIFVTGDAPVASDSKRMRIASRVTTFLCEYKEQGKLLGMVSQQVPLQC